MSTKKENPYQKKNKMHQILPCNNYFNEYPTEKQTKKILLKLCVVIKDLIPIMLEYLDDSLHLIPISNLREKNYVLKIYPSYFISSFAGSSPVHSFMECGISRLHVNYNAEILIFFEQQFLRKRNVLYLDPLCCKWFANELIMFQNYFLFPTVPWPPLRNQLLENHLDFCSKHKAHYFISKWTKSSFEDGFKTVNIIKIG